MVNVKSFDVETSLWNMGILLRIGVVSPPDG